MSQSKRNYNVFFDLHSVSGIVISIALFVIFLCGAFTLIKNDISNWERNKNTTEHSEFNVDEILNFLVEEGYQLSNASISIRDRSILKENMVGVSIDYPKLTSTESQTKKSDQVFIDSKEWKFLSFDDDYTYGSFLFRLHYFRQIPYIGIYLAGLVSLFFSFAIVTGIVVHWNKLVKNFFLIRPKKKLKTFFTDAHTVLGVIGIPFQLMYGISGAFIGLSILALLPAAGMYNGDTEKALADFYPNIYNYELSDKQLEVVPPISDFFKEAKTLQPNVDFHEVAIFNYGNETMHLNFHGDSEGKKLINTGNVLFRIKDEKLIKNKKPTDFEVKDSGLGWVLTALHFGEFGGLGMKTIYFLLSIISLFVIISGVLIWLEARNKKNNSPKIRKKNLIVEKSYLGISYGLIITIALFFSIILFLPRDNPATLKFLIHSIFFITWLITSIILYLKYERTRTAIRVFFLSGCLFLVPVFIKFVLLKFDFHESFSHNNFAVHFFLLLSAMICYFISFLIKTKNQNKLI